MFCNRNELTLDDMIADPIVQALMAADGVDVDRFVEEMNRMAKVVRERDVETAKARQSGIHNPGINGLSSDTNQPSRDFVLQLAESSTRVSIS